MCRSSGRGRLRGAFAGSPPGWWSTALGSAGALARCRLEVERARVDAVPKAGRAGAVLEDVPEVPPAAPAHHLGPAHAVAVIGVEVDVLRNGGLGEARPPGPRIELGIGSEQGGPTGRAPVHAV